MVNKMSRQEAIEYLKRKGKDVTEENIKACQSQGKIYGDPLASIDW